MAQKVRACAYLECSAKTGEGIREVFETATRVALSSENNLQPKRLSKLTNFT